MESVAKITEQLNVKCSECDFSTMSEQGLKTHKKRKHKTANKSEENLTYHKQCDLCEKDLKDKNDMKVHMKTHSYKRAEFKCEECEFCGESELTMEVHLGKNHGEIFECGLCGFVAKDLENLEMHLFTCEFFLCKECDKRFTNLSAIKEHLLDGEHRIVNQYYYEVIHAKQERGNKEEINLKKFI